jgi:hypothetical protein
MVMGSCPELKTASVPVAALTAARLAAQVGIALASVPFRRPWQGPVGRLHNLGTPARRVRAARADPDALRARVDRYARDVRSAFDRAPEQRRAVLERLLAGRRMTVYAEPEPGFRVEGLFELGLEMTSARSPEGDRATRNGGSRGVLRPGVAAPRS